METHIIFKADGLLLEGLLQRQPGSDVAVITHPHSLYGGEMHNPVVETITRAFAAKGYSSLRFNFRGVGGSEGVFDNGCGEGRDVLAAIQYIFDAGMKNIHLAGYSFGARVLAGINPPEYVISQIYVAPPVTFMDFSPVAKVKGLQAVITGENDEIAPPDEISKYLDKWNPTAQMHRITNCDHFYSNAMDKLAEILAEVIN